MSRSNPNTGSSNPSTRWYDWKGDKGVVHYYDKTTQQNVEVPLPFTFILLDEMATVKGWHDASDSGIYANEVRDTRQETLVVKAFKGGELASGIYASIRDRVGSMGGHFVANLYIAYRADKGLAIGSLQFKGAALKSWMEFKKASKKGIYEKAITITGCTEGKKGKVVFQMPDFTLSPISDASNAAATALDAELQDYLKAYLSRTKDQAAQVSAEDLAKADAAFAGSHDDDAAADQEAARQAAKRAERSEPADDFVDDELPVF
ncbi:MAG TPA: hypothetical protein VHQ21_17085 [Rhodanobacteraceae bacterium]|jgi:hypothetical protein|nr:hypothetical protein [Rhodanobacteraceae bacterium]